MTVKQQIEQLEKHLDRELDKMKEYIDIKVAPLHDYMIGQKAVAGTRSPKDVSAKDVMAFVLKVLAFVAAMLGIKYLQ
jgi:hypothetical protein